MKQYKIIKTTAKLLIVFGLFAVLTVVASTNFILKADTVKTVTTEVPAPDLIGDYPNLQTSRIGNVGTLLDRGLEFLEYFLGTIALIGFMISGIQFGMAGGDATKQAKAKMSLIYCAVGIVISVLALVLTRIGFNLLGSDPP